MCNPTNEIKADIWTFSSLLNRKKTVIQPLLLTILALKYPPGSESTKGSLFTVLAWCLSSSQVPDSYHYRRRVHLYDTAAWVQSEPRGVDTSDLGVKEDEWLTDEAAATLLGYAEEEVMGHKV